MEYWNWPAGRLSGNMLPAAERMRNWCRRGCGRSAAIHFLGVDRGSFLVDV